MIIKLNLTDSKGPVLLNSRHIMAVTESTSRPVTWVHMTDGKSYEVRESVVDIEAKLRQGGT